MHQNQFQDKIDGSHRNSDWPYPVGWAIHRPHSEIIQKAHPAPRERTRRTSIPFWHVCDQKLGQPLNSTLNAHFHSPFLASFLPSSPSLLFFFLSFFLSLPFYVLLLTIDSRAFNWLGSLLHTRSPFLVIFALALSWVDSNTRVMKVFIVKGEFLAIGTLIHIYSALMGPVLVLIVY